MVYVIDDYCYLNGESCEWDKGKPYVIVTGKRGIGKSSYCREMSRVKPDIQYVIFQSLDRISYGDRVRALEVILIMSIK